MVNVAFGTGVSSGSETLIVLLTKGGASGIVTVTSPDVGTITVEIAACRTAPEASAPP